MSSDDVHNENNGFLTSVWGPMLWSLLHIVSLNFPLEPTDIDRDHYYDFIMSLIHVLPCGACRKNMKKNLKNVKLTKKGSLKNRESFTLWMFRFHKEVNTMLGKTNTPTLVEVKNRYEMFRAKCGKPKYGETGCIKPVNNVRTKCVIAIVPDTLDTLDTFHVDTRCFPKNE